MKLVICNNTKENFLWERMSHFTKWHLTHEISDIYLCFHNSCEIWHLFSLGPMRNSLWCYYRLISYIYSPWKNVKKSAVLFKLFWYKVFVHWKLKLLNFLMDSVLIDLSRFTLYSEQTQRNEDEARVDNFILCTRASSWCLCLQECGKGLLFSWFGLSQIQHPPKGHYSN